MQEIHPTDDVLTPDTEDVAGLESTPPRKLRRPKRLRARPRELTIEQILEWADAYYAARKRWPTAKSGAVAQTVVETWSAINAALREGLRGLPGGSSLAQLLTEHRGYRNIQALPRLTEDLILQWADQHFQRTGRWPEAKDGPVEGQPGETWPKIISALFFGARGLPGDTSLAKLLAARRGRRNPKGLPPLSVEQILQWSDAFFERADRYPTSKDGEIPGTGGETWEKIDAALYKGKRGLEGGTSLPQLLDEQRGVRNRKALPPLVVAQIIAWARAYYERHGHWPNEDSGPVEEAPGETWCGVNGALTLGCRGLPGGTSLYRVLLDAGLSERLPGH